MQLDTDEISRCLCQGLSKASHPYARAPRLRQVLCLWQAKQVAGESAAAEARAAGAALRAVEAGIALYAERRDYLKLKDIAEASDVAGKVCVPLVLFIV